MEGKNKSWDGGKEKEEVEEKMQKRKRENPKKFKDIEINVFKIEVIVWWPAQISNSNCKRSLPRKRQDNRLIFLLLFLMSYVV